MEIERQANHIKHTAQFTCLVLIQTFLGISIDIQFVFKLKKPIFDWQNDRIFNYLN